MRLFWTIVSILIACGVAYVVVTPGQEPEEMPPAQTPAADPVIPDAPVPPQAERDPQAAPPPPGYPHPDSLTDALVSGDWSGVDLPGATHTTTPAAQATGDSPKVDGPATPATKPAETKKSYEIAKGTITKDADGSLLIDGRITLKGSGTDADPYVVPWELLTSAESTYSPRQALRQIPEGVALLDGKRVRISSNVAFPLYIQQPTEVLAMLNQWDGCCIGVPPTPYDAIEVRLAKPVKGNDRFATSGVVEGTFAVKPYVTGNWLVGLYVIENGALVPGEFGASPAPHGQDQ